MRTVLTAFVVLITASAFAAETQRYLVATRRPAAAGGLAVATATLRDPGARRVAAFELFRGFAADLTESELDALRNSSDVRWVEPVVARHRADAGPRPGEQLMPAGIAHVRAPEAWNARQSAQIHVAIIDTGVDFRHPELQYSWSGGTNVLDPAATPIDDSGHGTHVAGTIAARNNRSGLVGVTRNVQLWGVKALDAAGEGNVENIIKGLDWIVNKKREIGGRWVVNLSLTGSQESWAEREAIQRAFDAGLLIVAAAGNHTTATSAAVSYPAAIPGVVAVGAVDADDHIAPFSNRGPELGLVAPGVDVWSTTLTGTNFVSWVRRAAGPLVEGRALTGSGVGRVTAPYVYCGLGSADDITYAVQGKIVLMKRGGETFAVKTRRARDHGAAAVAIFNDRKDANLWWTLYGPNDDPTESWPVTVALLQESGETLAAQGGGMLTVASEPHDYVASSGTSMAAPHVAGAAAFLWSIAPNATPDNIITALTATATDLGSPGHDATFGHGLIDIYAAARMLAPDAFVETDSEPKKEPPSERRGKR